MDRDNYPVWLQVSVDEGFLEAAAALGAPAALSAEIDTVGKSNERYIKLALITTSAGRETAARNIGRVSAMQTYRKLADIASAGTPLPHGQVDAATGTPE